MRDQDEIYEAATEEPATLGCPSLVPGKVIVHEEPGGETLAELQRKGEQLKACNDRSYAKMVRIAELANECVLKTTHAEYMPGQYGQDYREFGKTMGEIRELVGKSLVERFAQKTQLKPLVKRCAKTPETIVMQTTLPSGRCLSAEWLAESSDHRTQAFIYDDDKMVCRIEFFDGYQTRNIGFCIMKQAFRGLVSRAGHMGRLRANKKAKKGCAK